MGSKGVKLPFKFEETPEKEQVKVNYHGGRQRSQGVAGKNRDAVGTKNGRIQKPC